jgi:glyoxylase-like metal-dependent hydrolase (beta-lactamase superfamily II)/rhodanese-related sulfurtransferase
MSEGRVVPGTRPVVAVVVVPVVDEGLGNSAYLVDLGDGRGLVVDAGRDLRGLRRAAEAAGLRVAFAADTHLHADFVSAAVQLAADDGARVLASAGGGREFGHVGLDDGDEVDLGGLRLRVLATPGHTGEHLAFLLLDGDRPVGVFTGGSLIVGSAARTDLVAPDRTVELARAQYASIQRLLALPDDLPVWPTHGAGSFCSAPPGGDRTSTIGRERTTNPLLVAPDGGPAGEDEFVSRLLAGLGSYPSYFGRLGEVNRRGPALVPASVTPRGLGVDEVLALRSAGAQVVDVRPVEAFAAGHVPGSVSNPLRAAFGTWLGWLTDPDRPVVVVRDPGPVDGAGSDGDGQDLDEVAWQALKVGYDTVVGELDGGLPAWRAAGLPVAATALVTPADAARCRETATVLDVRQASEFTVGHLPGAVHVELGRLLAPAVVAALPSGPLLVMCGHGERAMSAASLLMAAGRADVTVLAGGPHDLAAATRAALVRGAGAPT